MRILNRVLTIAVVIAIFYFLTRNLMANWSRIPFADLRFNPVYLSLSFFFLLVYFLVLTRGWSQIVAELGIRVRYGRAFWVMSTSQIAKYVPGGIWYTLGRVYLGKREKITEEIGLLSVVFETFLILLTNLVIFLISMNFVSGKPLLSPFVSIIFILLILVLLYPPLLNILLNIVLRLLKRPKVTLRVRYTNILKLSTYFFTSWLAQIIGFYFLLNSIYPIGTSQLANLTAAYTLSWITGFVVLFAPGGLGVREGMMTLLLSSILPTPLAIAISFVARIWVTIFELVIFFVGLIIRRTTTLKPSP